MRFSPVAYTQPPLPLLVIAFQSFILALAMKVRAYEVQVKVDERPLQEHAMRYEEDKTATCFIASETGKVRAYHSMPLSRPV